MSRSVQNKVEESRRITRSLQTKLNFTRKPLHGPVDSPPVSTQASLQQQQACNVEAASPVGQELTKVPMGAIGDTSVSLSEGEIVDSIASLIDEQLECEVSDDIIILDETLHAEVDDLPPPHLSPQKPVCTPEAHMDEIASVMPCIFPEVQALAGKKKPKLALSESQEADKEKVLLPKSGRRHVHARAS